MCMYCAYVLVHVLIHWAQYPICSIETLKTPEEYPHSIHIQKNISMGHINTLDNVATVNSSSIKLQLQSVHEISSIPKTKKRKENKRKKKGNKKALST